MSSDEILIGGKLLLTFGVLLGLPLWELFSLRREQHRERRRRVDQQPPAAPTKNLACARAVEDKNRRHPEPCP